MANTITDYGNLKIGMYGAGYVSQKKLAHDGSSGAATMAAATPGYINAIVELRVLDADAVNFTIGSTSTKTLPMAFAANSGLVHALANGIFYTTLAGEALTFNADAACNIEVGIIQIPEGTNITPGI